MKIFFEELVSISSMFYQQLLRNQIPKVQKSMKTWLSFCTFRICAHQKLLGENWLNWPQALYFTKILWAAFLYENFFLHSLQLSFVIFWQNNVGTKSARKILAKMTRVQHWFRWRCFDCCPKMGNAYALRSTTLQIRESKILRSVWSFDLKQKNIEFECILDSG